MDNRTTGIEAVAPLEEIRVLDFTRFVAGPYCTMLLADCGAEVIKVEPPGGEHSRELSPFLDLPNGEELSIYFLRFNRGKKSVILSPKSPEGRADLERLIVSADILVENFRPGVLESWGLSWSRLQELNPQLIYASISGFGHSQTDCRRWPAFNLVAEVMAGVLSQTATNGQVPRAVGLPVGDSVPSLHALAGILMALVRRHRTGRGSRVDIAMFDSMISLNELGIAVQSGTGQVQEIGERLHEWFAPFGLFEAADGWLCIAVGTDQQWHDFCDATGLQELELDSRLTDGRSRSIWFNEVIAPKLKPWLRGRTARSAAEVLARSDVPAAPLLDGESLLTNEQAHERNMLPLLDAGGTALHLAGNPIRIEPRSSSNATGFCAVGENTEEILGPLRSRTT